MTTENQPARMGDAAIAQAFRTSLPLNSEQAIYAQRIERRARELSAHGGDGSGDRAALKHIATVLGPKVPKCCQGCRWEWQEALQTATAALATQQPASGEVGGAGDAVAHDFSDDNGKRCIACGASEWDAGGPCQSTTPATAAHGGSGEAPQNQCHYTFGGVRCDKIIGHDGLCSGEVCGAVSPEEEAEIDEACGLVKLTFRLPIDLHNKVSAYADSRQFVFPAALRELLEMSLTSASDAEVEVVTPEMVEGLRADIVALDNHCSGPQVAR